MEKIEKKEFYVLQHEEFEKLILRTLGFIYESVAENEWNNYSSYKAENIQPEDSITKDEILLIEEAIQTGKGRGIYFNSLLEYMVLMKFIPAGNYLIEVYW